MEMLLCEFSIAQKKRENKYETCMFVFIYNTTKFFLDIYIFWIYTLIIKIF